MALVIEHQTESENFSFSPSNDEGRFISFNYEDKDGVDTEREIFYIAEENNRLHGLDLQYMSQSDVEELFSMMNVEGDRVESLDVGTPQTFYEDVVSNLENGDAYRTFVTQRASNYRAVTYVRE